MHLKGSLCEQVFIFVELLSLENHLKRQSRMTNSLTNVTEAGNEDMS